MQEPLKPVDKVEIITLEDNYIDLVSMDNSDVVRRAIPLRGAEFSNSILAEHGFSCLVRVTNKEETRTMLFDFGLSRDVAARNAEALSVDLSQVEAAALSHGHMDHFGGMALVAEKITQKNIALVVHPGVFKKSRCLEPFPGFKITMPVLKREAAQKAGFAVTLAEMPYPMLSGHVVFLGGIPRSTPFETGMPNAFYEAEDGNVLPDPIEDDSAIVMNLSGKGLIVISGCAHSGIINTVEHAKNVTGETRVHAVMGGFHLGGPSFESIIEPTVQAMKQIAPNYIVPTHCTGRKAVMTFEREFPKEFILNMAGTTLTFQ